MHICKLTYHVIFVGSRRTEVISKPTDLNKEKGSRKEMSFFLLSK